MKPIEIDIVSDVVCPWCAVGYAHLNKALDDLQAENIQANIHWRAFELNPYMGSDGQEINEHLMEKYGSTAEQLAANKQRLVEIGQHAGLNFKFDERSRIYNTFDCHKLLHWVGELQAESSDHKDLQTALKQALFTAYFTEGQDVSDRTVLLNVIKTLGLNVEEAERILDSEQVEQAVRSEQKQYQEMGISAVPTFIINQQYLISGGQPVDVFKQALTEIAGKDKQ